MPKIIKIILIIVGVVALSGLLFWVLQKPALPEVDPDLPPGSQISKPSEISNYYKFDLKSLKQVREHELFYYYPQTVCVIKAMLGEEYEEIQRKEHKSGLSGVSLPWETDDSDGGMLHARWSWQTPAYFRLLWVHPNGTIVVGINDEEKKEITFFSNNREIKNKQPYRMTKWLEYLETERYNYRLPEVIWKIPASDELYFPADCQTNVLAEDINDYLAAQKGESCSVDNLHNLRFEGRWPYLVKTDDLLERVYLRQNPDRSENITGSHAYLIDGDMVQLLNTDFEISEKNGFVCAFYRALTGKETMGWIEKEKVIEMPDDVKNDEVDAYFVNVKHLREWASKMFYNDQIYPGQGAYSPIGIDRMKDPDILTIKKLDGSLEVKSIISREGKIYMSPPVDYSGVFNIVGDALAEHRKEGGCHTKLYLFNNGAYLIDRDEYGRGPCLLDVWGVAIFYPILNK